MIDTLFRFGVFALGSRAYPNFCAFGRWLDETIADLGAYRMCPLGEGDDQYEQAKTFQGWKQTFVKVEWFKTNNTYTYDSNQAHFYNNILIGK